MKLGGPLSSPSIVGSGEEFVWRSWSKGERTRETRQRFQLPADSKAQGALRRKAPTSKDDTIPTRMGFIHPGSLHEKAMLT